MDEKIVMTLISTRTCLLSVGLCLLPMTTSLAAIHLQGLGEIRQQIGIDGQHRSMEFAQPFGDELFRENYADYNLYLAVRWSKHFGVAIGHENSNTRKRTKSFAAGSAFLGQILANQETHQGSSEIKGNYIELLGFIPLDSLNMRKAELFAGIGMIKNKLALENITTQVNNIPVSGAAFRDNYHDKRNNLRAELGLQKIFYNHFGIRASLSWEKTSRFRNLKPDATPDAASIVNLKNTWSTGAGLFWLF